VASPNGWRRITLQVRFERYADDVIARCKIWSFGPSVNTKSCDAITGVRHTGSRAFRDELWSCLLTGRWGVRRASMVVLYELGGSCTVLREPRSETPRDYFSSS
jgi:hypothetical protein